MLTCPFSVQCANVSTLYAGIVVTYVFDIHMPTIMYHGTHIQHVPFWNPDMLAMSSIYFWGKFKH